MLKINTQKGPDPNGTDLSKIGGHSGFPLHLQFRL